MSVAGGGVYLAGVHRMRLGSGGRLVIPKAFRDQLETDTVTVGLAPQRGTLVIMPPGVLRAALEKLADDARRGLALTCDQTKVARYLDTCQQALVSSQGRITLHRVFLGRALHDEAEAVLLGLGNKILVVGAMVFDAMAAETRDALASELATVYEQASEDERCPGRPGVEQRKEPQSVSKTERQQQKLALEGGLKAVTTIQGKGKPKIGKEEFMAVVERFALPADAVQRVSDALSDEDFAGGPYLANYYSSMEETCNQAFARVAREVFGVKYALPTSSGTAALHAAFVAAGVKPGTEVICSAIGFYATAAAVVMAKGVPVFCDVDESLHMDPTKIEALINPRTACIAPTHVMGSVAKMDAIMKVAKKHKIPVVEDCAQSCGGKVKGKYVGTWGDLGIFSISSYKIVGGGEGGMLVTNKEKLYDAACILAEGGGLTRPVRFGPERYPGELFVGTNYRMSELEAAIDAVQLKKMPALFKRFHNVKMRILGQLKTFAEITPQKLNDPDGEVGYTLRFFPATIELGRQIVTALNAEGVGCGMRGDNAAPDWHIYHYMFPLVLQQGAPGKDNCPFGCERYLQAGGKADYSKGLCPVADDLFDRMISVGLNQWYSAADCKHIAGAINKVLGAYCTADAKATPWV